MTDDTALTIPPLAFGDLSEEAQDVLRPRYERLGYLGDVFGALGHNDSALRAFVAFADASATPVDQNLREVVALAAAAASNAEPELFQHERRALGLGFTRAEIAAIETLDPDHPDLPTGGANVVAATVSVVRQDWAAARAAMSALVAKSGPEHASGVLLQIGYYVMATSIGHALGLTPPVNSIFAEVERQL